MTDIEKKMKPRSVADPDPGYGAFLTPGSRILDSGWVKSQAPDPGSGAKRNNPDHIYFRELRNHFLGVKMIKFFDADPGSRKKFRSGIQDKPPGSATL